MTITGSSERRYKTKGTSLCYVSGHITRLLTFLHLLDFLLLLVYSSAEEREDDTSLGVYTDRCYQHFAGAWNMNQTNM